MSHNNEQLHLCNDTCVVFFLSKLAISLKDYLQIVNQKLPTCVLDDEIASYIGADVWFSERYSTMHEMLFLRPNDFLATNHGPVARLYKNNCEFEDPCAFWETAEANTYFCQDPVETFVSFQKGHVCTAACASIAMYAWKQCEKLKHQH